MCRGVKLLANQTGQALAPVAIVARSVHDRVARRYLVESTSGVHASTSKEGVTGHFGTPMKETGGLSQPLRSLNHPNKTKYYTIILGLNRSSGEIEWREAVE